MFRAFPKIEQLHTDATYDEIYDIEFPVNLVAKSLRSLVIRSSEKIQITAFLTQLFTGLTFLALECIDTHKPINYVCLSCCPNLLYLRLSFDGLVNFSFLPTMPNLKYLEVFSDCGIRREDAAQISYGAPNLNSLSLSFFNRVHPRSYYEELGRELCTFKKLIIFGDEPMILLFAETFLADHSLFSQVQSLHFVSFEENVECPKVSDECRPQCTISHHFLQPGSSAELCLVCWEMMTPNRTCPRCNCFIYALHY